MRQHRRVHRIAMSECSVGEKARTKRERTSSIDVALGAYLRRAAQCPYRQLCCLRYSWLSVPGFAVTLERDAGLNRYEGTGAGCSAQRVFPEEAGGQSQRSKPCCNCTCDSREQIKRINEDRYGRGKAGSWIRGVEECLRVGFCRSGLRERLRKGEGQGNATPRTILGGSTQRTLAAAEFRVRKAGVGDRATPVRSGPG